MFLRPLSLGSSYYRQINAAQGREHDATANLADAFTTQTSTATGASERSVQRDAQRGEKIGREALGRVAGTSLDKGEELDALAKLSEDKRKALIDRAVKGDKVSAKVELKKDVRAGREAALGARQIAMPTKEYGVIVEDYEWDQKMQFCASSSEPTDRTQSPNRV